MARVSFPVARAVRALALTPLVLGGYEGQASGSDEGGSDADEVVVLGSTPSAGFVSKASVDDAPREITDASSLIETVPGVHVRRLGGDDSFATLSIRGSTSSEVAILFGGVPMTGAADPTLDLSTLPLWPGARIRVYRSFAPASYGPGSLGGTLVLEPPRTSDPERTETWAAVGSFGEARLRFADVRAVGDGRAVTALSASRADDDFTFDMPISGAAVTRQNNGHAAVNGLFALSLPAGEGTLTVMAMVQGRQQGIPGSISDPTPFATLTSNRELLSLELSQRAGSGAWSIRGWARRDELSLADKPSAFLPTSSSNVIAAVGVSAGWRGSVARDVTLEARVDGSAEGNEPGVTIGTPPGTPEATSATRLAVGAGVDADWRATKAWKLGASGRVDTDVDTLGSAGNMGSTSPPPPSAGTEVRPTGHIGSEIQLGPAVLAAHGGAVARPASFVELYGSPGGVIPNPLLTGESAWTVDAGAHAASHVGRMRTQAEVVLFGTWARNLILFEPEGFEGFVQAKNIGQARIDGLEASLAAWAYGFDLRAAYTGLMTFNDSLTGSPPLEGRPDHDLVGDLGYSLGPVRVRYGVDAVIGMHYDTLGLIVVPPQVLQSAGARVDVPGVPGLRVALEIRNLFDLRTLSYPGFPGTGPSPFPIGDQYSYPLPGRSFLVTARWTSAPTPTRDLPPSER